MTNIKGLIPGERVDIFGIVSSLQERTKKDGGTYIDLRLEDISGSVDCKIWDAALDDIAEIEVGKLVKARALVTEWNGKSQLNIQMIRLSDESDQVSIEDFIKGPPISAQEMMGDLTDIVEGFSSQSLKNICLYFLEKYKEPLAFFPAAQMVHHAMKGGLLYHIHTMISLALIIGDRYPGVDKDLLAAGTIIHDIGKLKEMDSDENGKVSGYTLEGQLLGHIIQGTLMLHDMANELREKGLEVDEGEVMLLEHMIASHHFDETWGAYQKPAFLEAELLHHVDMIDSKVNIFVNVLEGMEEGTFSDSQRFLGGRKIYKP